MKTIAAASDRSHLLGRFEPRLLDDIRLLMLFAV
jgi:hypothetical protein